MNSPKHTARHALSTRPAQPLLAQGAPGATVRNKLVALVAGAAVAAGGAAVVVGTTAAGASDARRATTHVVQQGSRAYRVIPAHWERNLLDRMNRHVAAGFGTADQGGAWSSSNAKLLSVGSGGGRIGALSAGDAVRATVDGAVARDEFLTANFVVNTVPRGTDTSFVAVELRRQNDGDSYRVRARIDARGRMTLTVARLVNGRETQLGRPTPVTGAAVAGHTLTVAARITGDAPVHINAIVKPSGTGTTTWADLDDTSPARIATPGRYGILAGNARNAAGMTATLRTLTGFQLLPATRVPVDPTPQPSAPAPSGTGSAPGSSDPAPQPTDPAPSGSTTSPAPGGSTTTTTTPPPPPPVPSSGRGAGDPGSASYPVPAGAVFVSPSGSDTAAGTQAAPLRTIAHAIAVARSGGTIVLRAGLYHESLNVAASKQLTIQNYPGEAAWLDGSVPVSTWTQQGSTWVHDGWTAKFDSTAGTSKEIAAAYPWLRPGYPMAAHPDQVFVDGVQLKQVGSAAQVVPGTFYSDYANNRIVMGTNPAGHEVRASDLQVALTVWSAGSVVRGIGIRRYATSVIQPGTLSMRAPNQVVQNVIVTDNATAGIHVNSQSQLLDHLTVTNNGLQGIHGIADRVTISNSVVTGNDSQFFNTAPVSAGIKLSWSDYDTITNNLIANNNGNGLWFDMSSYGMKISGNDVINNEHIGVSIEISKAALIVGNTVANNHWDGIRVCDSSDVRIWNNLLQDNDDRNLDIAQDARTTNNSSRPYPTNTVDWKVNDVEAHNNVFVGSGAHVNYGDPVRKIAPMQRAIVVDNNLLSMIDGRKSSAFVTNAGHFNRYTLAQWIGYTGTGAHNMQSSGTTTSAMAAQMSSASYAAPLPADVAALLGEPVGAKVWGRS